MFGASPAEKAYLGPFIAFLGLLAVGEFIGKLFDGQAIWLVAQPRYWVYPLQVLLCGALLWRGWKYYGLRAPRAWGWIALTGIAAFLRWIAPQAWGDAAPRLDGFMPGFFGSGPVEWLNLAFRFARLVVIVPLVEEIFWRGFLLRTVIRPDFLTVPFGTFDARAFALTTAGFCLEHPLEDWPASVIAGALYNLVAFRTRSLAACVCAHALTNALLGGYVLRTGQWGFW